MVFLTMEGVWGRVSPLAKGGRRADSGAGVPEATPLLAGTVAGADVSLLGGKRTRQPGESMTFPEARKGMGAGAGVSGAGVPEATPLLAGTVAGAGVSGAGVMWALTVVAEKRQSG